MYYEQYSAHLDEYFDVITDKFHSGRISLDKATRLTTKINEWDERAEEVLPNAEDEIERLAQS